VATARIRATLDIEESIVPPLGLSLRREFAEVDAFEVQIADAATDPLPSAHITTPRAVIVQTDVEVTVTLGAITLQPGGYIIIADGTPATNPPTVNNASGGTATIRGAVLGS
jgi:hypothetical protein